MKLVLKCLVSIIYLISLPAAASAAAADEVSVQSVTGQFKQSQEALKSAYKIKSIERALRALSDAEVALKKAKAVLSERSPITESEGRMKSRLMYKLDQDQRFLNQLRADLGMAEMDPFEQYIDIRRSFLKAPDKRPLVVKLDQQILLSLEARSLK